MVRAIPKGLGRGYTANGESSSEPADIVDSALRTMASSAMAEIFGDVGRREWRGH